MTNDELDRLQGLCDGATPGPWGLDGPGGDEYDKVTAETPDFIDVAYDVLHDGDAAFIAAARTALPALIAEVRRLQPYEDWARKIAKLPCCNDCADAKTCDKRPKWGEVCAVNCPLWRGPQPAKEDK